ncbi:MAG: sulfite exporter TauE/SafE family protein, partial [Candidatus Rokuibacteriota bacterium]
VTTVLGLCALLDFVSGVALAFHTRRQAERRELVALLPFTLVGIALGTTVLVRLPRDAALAALGIFVCTYAVYAVAHRDTTRRVGRWWAGPAGLTGGLCGALFGVGGPPYVLYLTARVRDKGAQRATIAAMLVVSVGARLAAFLIAGVLWDTRLWLLAIVLLPVAGLGIWTGNRLHGRVTPAVMARMVSAVLFFSGASLVYRTL